MNTITCVVNSKNAILYVCKKSRNNIEIFYIFEKLKILVRVKIQTSFLTQLQYHSPLPRAHRKKNHKAFDFNCSKLYIIQVEL